MKKVYIISAKRSALGSFNGTLSNTTAANIAIPVIKDILSESNLPADIIDEVIVGGVLTAGTGQGIARQISIGAGIPVEVPAYGINMVCGSGMKAVSNAFAGIQSGFGDIYIAGGTENMTLSPYIIPNARQGLRMGNKEILDHLIHDALEDAFEGYHMGITAENIAEKYNISREDQENFSVNSQKKALEAISNNKFKNEITPITVKVKREEVIFDTDEYPNPKTSLEKLASLRPAFKKDGTVTAGTSSGINDGAAFLLIASEEAVEKYNLIPMAEVIAVGQGGVEPSLMGLGPVPAIANVLKTSKLKLSDMDYIELNEAFAVQSLGVLEEISKDSGESVEDILNRTNINGGAIALGHPLGASGARIIVTLAHILKDKKAKYGLASLCIGGGMGTAIILKNM